ncbi:hypothetical protein Q3G72_023642 [Acer saccharum]|nr:hypothetical protein Q3G72_023642 [Acer saccharum]
MGDGELDLRMYMVGDGDDFWKMEDDGVFWLVFWTTDEDGGCSYCSGQLMKKMKLKHIETTLRRVIEDTVRKGITHVATAGITSPYDLSTLIVRLAQMLRSKIVVPMPDAPLRLNKEPK